MATSHHCLAADTPTHQSQGPDILTQAPATSNVAPACKSRLTALGLLDIGEGSCGVINRVGRGRGLGEILSNLAVRTDLVGLPRLNDLFVEPLDQERGLGVGEP